MAEATGSSKFRKALEDNAKRQERLKKLKDLHLKRVCLIFS